VQYIIYINTLIGKANLRVDQSTGISNRRKSSILRKGRIIAACDENTRNVYEPVVRGPQVTWEGKPTLRCPDIRGYNFNKPIRC